MKWEDIFKQIKQSHDFSSMDNYLEVAYKERTVYPKHNDIYNAFRFTPFDEVKVVILGQDPYHGPNQAHGLAFSVVNETLPPSLKNIFKELVDDIGCVRESGNLTSWATEGVLLLNTVLTVEAGKAHSHKEIGWTKFTDGIIQAVSEHHSHVVFILWGKPAQQKIHLIDMSKHTIITSVHPSPLSAYRGFFGSKPFSQANNALLKHGQQPVNWCKEG